MSEQVRPPFDHVRKFIATTVEPMSHEFYRAGEKNTDRWSFAPEQLDILGRAKKKAKEEGLLELFFSSRCPDGRSCLKNLDYAYIAA